MSTSSRRPPRPTAVSRSSTSAAANESDADSQLQQRTEAKLSRLSVQNHDGGTNGHGTTGDDPDGGDDEVTARIAQRREARAAARKKQQSASISSFPDDDINHDNISPEVNTISASAPPLARASPMPSSSTSPPVVIEEHTAPPVPLSRTESLLKRTKSQRVDRTITAEMFVQRWQVKQVKEAYERLYTVLFPHFEPTTASENDLQNSFDILRDDWSNMIADNTQSILVHEIHHQGKYSFDEPNPERPLVLQAEQMKQLIRSSFDRDTPVDDHTTIGSDRNIQLHQIRLQLQHRLRLFLDLFLNLHQATLPETPLRDSLRETISLLVASSYGFELSLFATALQSYRTMPSSSLSPGTIQKLVGEVLAIGFQFNEIIQDDEQSKETLIQFLLSILRSHVQSLTPTLSLSILELTMTLHAEEYENEMIAKYILPTAWKSVPPKFLSWCSCGRGGSDTVNSTSTSTSPRSNRRLSYGISGTTTSTTEPALCSLCQSQEQDDQMDSSKLFAKLIFYRMIESVVDCKTIETVVHQFQHSAYGVDLPSNLIQVTNFFCPSSGITSGFPTSASSSSRSTSRLNRSGIAGQQMLCNLFLLGCRWAQASLKTAQPSLHATQRTIHGLRLVLSILRRSNGFFCASSKLIMLLRSIFFPILVDCTMQCFARGESPEEDVIVEDRETIFRYALSLYIHFFDSLQAYLPNEVGLMMQHIWIPALESNWSNLKQKQQILEMLRFILRTPRAVMSVFFNYDYHKNEWKVLERLFTALMHLLEGEVESFPSIPSAVSSDVTSLSTSLFALKLLVHLFSMQAQWIGVPGIKRVPNVPRPLQDQGMNKKAIWQAVLQQQQREQQIEDQVLQLARGGKIKAALQYLQQMKPGACSMSEMARYLYEAEGLNPSDLGDFLANLDDNFLNAKQYEQLRLAYVHKLDFYGLPFSEGLRVFLCSSGFRLPGEAQKIDRLLSAFCEVYVEHNPGLFRNASSAFVVCFALVMLNTDLHDPRLRSGKSSRKPMTCDQFISNLRGVDDGHDFPVEFLKSMFQDIQQQSIEWKDANLEPPTVTAAKKKGPTLSRAELLQQSSEQSRRNLQQLSRRLSSQFHFTLAFNHSWQVPTRSWLVAPLFDSTWYRALGTISFLADQSPVGSTTEPIRRLDILALCLDGLAYGGNISTILGIRTEFSAFLTVLAKVTYVENARMEQRRSMLLDEIVRRQTQSSTSALSRQSSRELSPRAAAAATASATDPATTTDPSSSSQPSTPPPTPAAHSIDRERQWAQFEANLSKRIAKRQHLKQEWFLRLQSTDEALDPTTICRTIFATCTQLKQSLNDERRFLRLDELQTLFGADQCSLVTVGRQCLKEGKLIRFKPTTIIDTDHLTSLSNVDHRPFQFILCTDILLYAKSPKSKDESLQWRRAYHLILMEKPQLLTHLDDAESMTFPLTITTAQSLKPFILSVSNEQERTMWIESISSQIDIIRERFTRISSTLSLRESKLTSRFIGSTFALNLQSEPILIDIIDLCPTDTTCRLCLRTYHQLFRRITACGWCGERVCSECAQGKVKLPKELIPEAAAIKKENGSGSEEAMNGSMDSNSGSPLDELVSSSTNSTSSTSFFSKASASVSSMQNKFRSAIRSTLHQHDQDAGMIRITVCDACHLPLIQELETTPVKPINNNRITSQRPQPSVVDHSNEDDE